MLQAWPAIVFGWPAVLLALVLSAAGITRNKPVFLVAAAAIVTPFSLYLAANPGIGRIGLAIPLLLIGAGVAVHYRQTAVTWSLFTPVVVAMAWLAIVVMRQ